MTPAEYVTAGWSLVPIPARRKGPDTPGWNERENCITDPVAAERIRRAEPFGVPARVRWQRQRADTRARPTNAA